MSHYEAVLTDLSDRRFFPHAEKLFLHSGSTRGDVPARTDAQPNGRKRDKATQQAKAESNKRKIEEKIAELANTPTKRVSLPPLWPFWAIMAHADPYRLEVQSPTALSVVCSHRQRTWLSKSRV